MHEKLQRWYEFVVFFCLVVITEVAVSEGENVLKACILQNQLLNYMLDYAGGLVELERCKWETMRAMQVLQLLQYRYVLLRRICKWISRMCCSFITYISPKYFPLGGVQLPYTGLESIITAVRGERERGKRGKRREKREQREKEREREREGMNWLTVLTCSKLTSTLLIIIGKY